MANVAAITKSQVLEVAKILWQLQPAIGSFESEDQEAVIITEDLVASVRNTLDYLQKADSANERGILSEAIEREWSIINPERLVGLSAKEAWSKVVQQYEELIKIQVEESQRDIQSEESESGELEEGSKR